MMRRSTGCIGVPELVLSARTNQTESTSGEAHRVTVLEVPARRGTGNSRDAQGCRPVLVQPGGTTAPVLF